MKLVEGIFKDVALDFLTTSVELKGRGKDVRNLFVCQLMSCPETLLQSQVRNSFTVFRLM
jgi:hypothetical protein